MSKKSATTTGTLYIVATPIGNREDITLRALNVLKTVDIILAEDTRHSLPLLRTLGVQKPVISFHAHNETKKTALVIEALTSGKSYALISDAGTPLICDPGYGLVKKARAEGIPVVPIPGPCAFTTALSAAGIPCDSFLFLGFLPAKATIRNQALQSVKGSPHTVIFYESPHRLMDCLDAIAELFDPCYVFVIAKELTKAFERFITGTVKEIQSWLLEDKTHRQGEFVFLLPPQAPEVIPTHEEEILTVLLAELPTKQAVKLTATLTKKNKNDLYQLALDLGAG
ncbi:MAG: 16S rRNA (cytidine(1402)-2'-O)-methyltransferase [Legionella sp.]|nr:16S rRNA (cytidine(1402)-2'-O)-methyltransferase [Legionella sp.]